MSKFWVLIGLGFAGIYSMVVMGNIVSTYSCDEIFGSDLSRQLSPTQVVHYELMASALINLNYCTYDSYTPNKPEPGPEPNSCIVKTILCNFQGGSGDYPAVLTLPYGG